MTKRVKGPNSVGHYYMPTYHSRYSEFSKDKTRWIVTEDEEFLMFNKADEHSVSHTDGIFDLGETADYCWMNDNLKGLFSFLLDNNNNLMKVGEFGERFGFFPKVINQTDAWHGFPVKASDINYKMGENLMNYLVSIKELTDIDKARIIKRMI